MLKIYSKNEIKKAGKKLILNSNDEEALEILSYWRTTHAYALDNAYNLILQEALELDKNVLVAKRLKRTASIIGKLERFHEKGMQLTTMQDIGGCRVILSNLKKVNKLVKILNAKGDFELKNDYIKFPKNDGYRSVHMIGKFKNEWKEEKVIELQIRTKIQHSWATAVEIVDLFTNQSLKTAGGKVDWKVFFKYTGEQFALLEKNALIQSTGEYAIYTHFKEDFEREKTTELEKSLYYVYKQCKKLEILNKFNLFTQSLKVTNDHIQNISQDGYILLTIDNIDKKQYQINLQFFEHENVKEATDSYLIEEKKSIANAHYITALVSTSSIGGIKEAYPNYFADSTQFVKYLDIIVYFYTKYFNVFNTAQHWAKYR